MKITTVKVAFTTIATVTGPTLLDFNPYFGCTVTEDEHVEDWPVPSSTRTVSE
jgi:hypothetical protein